MLSTLKISSLVVGDVSTRSAVAAAEVDDELLFPISRIGSRGTRDAHSPNFEHLLIISAATVLHDFLLITR